MLHLLVPQSITPLIWAYLVFSLHMPFAPFWPSASIHSSIFLFSQRLTQPYTIVLVNENRLWYTNTHTHTHMHTTVWLTRADLVPEALIYFFFFFLLCSCTSSFHKCSKPVKTFACTHTHDHTTTFNRMDSCSWFCRRVAKSTSEESERKCYDEWVFSVMYTVCEIVYPNLREY